MLRTIIHIDEEKCNGCGLCANACHEGAIEMINGKAKLVREHFCDGLGDCLPSCPTGAITFEEREAAAYNEAAVKEAQASRPSSQETVSGLAQWPCQIKLVPVQAPFFDGAKLLITADCTAYAYARIHEDFMKGKTTIIGCPKLDDIDYTEKLTEIIRSNDIREVTVLRMEVSCCGGLQIAAENALRNSGKFIPWRIVTITRNGHISE